MSPGSKALTSTRGSTNNAYRWLRPHRRSLRVCYDIETGQGLCGALPLSLSLVGGAAYGPERCTVFDLFHQQAIGPLSDAVSMGLSHERGLDAPTLAGLSMVRQKGLYSGRKVTYFRVFDPIALKAAGTEPRHFADLDTAGVLYSGHVEPEGHIVLHR